MLTALKSWRWRCAATVVLLASFPARGAQAQCSGTGTWRALGSSEYMYCATDADFSTADADCATAAAGWTLTRVDDSAENTFISDLGGGANLWIGGDDQAVDGEWRWRDGIQFWQGDDNGDPVGDLYNNWTGGQPNAGGDEDCARMKGDGSWEDRKCTETEKYVCEGPPFCGSSARGAGEECDDGNTDDGDGCSSTCTLEGPAPCGDGLIWLGEECDDGAAVGGDGCSSTCEIEPGYTCIGEPSICMPDCAASFEWHSQLGPTTNEYYLCEKSQPATDAETLCEGLAPGWTLARIDDATENGFIDGLIGNHLWIGGHDEAVEGEWRWRDGVQFWQGDDLTGMPVGELYTNWKSGEPGGGTGENCGRQENGGLWQDRKCTDNEKFICEGPAICGNAFRGGGEECDDGNTKDGDGCSSSCTLEAPAPCGDGLIWLGEECDDGATVGGDGCSSTCEIEPGYTCTGVPSVCCAVCTAGCAPDFEWHSQMGPTTTEYFLCDNAQPATDAETICEGLAPGWTLARIDDATENGYIDGFIGNHLWIGGHDEAVEGEWRWRDGVQFWQGDDLTGMPVGELYTNWKSGEPGGGTGESCGRQENGGLWQDRKCTDNERFMCEGPPICGNGAVAIPEQCDDANTADGDGCSSSCLVEPGYECFLPDDMGTPSVCQVSADVVISDIQLLDVNGEAVLQWTTSSQSGTLGFVVSRLSGGVFLPVHDGMLVALPGTPQGGRYTLHDEAGDPRSTATYRIEEVAVGGARTNEGQWNLRATASTRVEIPAAGFAAVPHSVVRAAPVASRAHYWVDKGHVPRTANALVLDSDRDALYSLTPDAIANVLGRSRAEVLQWIANDDLRIRSPRGDEAWFYEPDQDAVLFVGAPAESVYSNTQPYLVEPGPASPMPMVDAIAGLGPLATGWVRYSRDENNFAGLVVSPDPDSDYWFAAALSAGAAGFSRYETAFDLPAVSLVGGTLQLALYGAWNLDEATAQSVRVELNGVELGVTVLSMLGLHDALFDVPQEILRSGSNTLVLTVDSQAPPGAAGLYVDRFELVLEQALSSDATQLIFEAPSSGSISARLAGSGEWIIDLTTQERIQAGVTPDPPLHSIVSFESLEGHRYLITSEPLEDASVRPSFSTGLKEPFSGAEYVVITPASLSHVAADFALYRENQGLYSVVVHLEDLFDRYASALPTPHAIHDFIAHASETWTNPPRYVLLLGDGTFDYRADMNVGPGLVPPRLVATKTGLFSADALLGDLDEDGFADVAVGRLPVRSEAEAAAALERIRFYEALQIEDFDIDGLVLSGVDRGADFTGSTDRLLVTLPSDLRSMAFDSTGVAPDDLKDELRSAFAENPFWFHYLGHGGLDRLDDQGTIHSDDVSALGNQLPFLMSQMSCSTARFEVPGVDSLSESMLRAEEGGAIAVWGPSGTTMSHEAAELAVSFAQSMWSEDVDRLGDLILAVHANRAAAYDAETLAVYNLLGDPALQLKHRAVEDPVADPGTSPTPDPGTRRAGGCALSPRGNMFGVFWPFVALFLIGIWRRVATTE